MDSKTPVLGLKPACCISQEKSRSNLCYDSGRKHTGRKYPVACKGASRETFQQQS